VGCRVCFLLVVFALAVRRRALTLFLLDIVASNCNLPRDRLLSALGSVKFIDIYWALSFILTYKHIIRTLRYLHFMVFGL